MSIFSAKTLREAADRCQFGDATINYREASIRSYHKQVARMTDSDISEKVASLFESLKNTLRKAAENGRYECEVVVGTYGHYNTWDRAGKLLLAEIAGRLRREIATRPESEGIRVSRFARTRPIDDHREYVLKLRW